MENNTLAAAKNGTAAWPWRPFLRSYDDSELTVLTFSTTEDTYRALDIASKGDLRGMPFAIADHDSLVVPNEAVPFFSDAALPFSPSKLLSHDDLTAEELNELRKQSTY